MAKIHQVALTLLLPMSYALAQQTITLNDGTQFQGHFDGGTRDLITFVDSQGVRHRFGVSQIQTLSFGDPGAYTGSPSGAPPQEYSNPGAPPPPNYSSNVPPPPSAYNQNAPGYNPNAPGYNPNANAGYNQQQPAYQQPAPAYQNGSAPGAAPAGNYATLPVNTQIAVRTSEPIHTSGGATGRTYASTIDRDVLDANGNLVIPRGANAVLVVRDMGNNQISLDLQSVSVNGQRYALNTQDVTQTGNANRGLGANRRTGEYVGGGAVLGTLLGAIAGGGRGAAIGAVAGAAAGAGTQVLTRGSEVKVPAETVLTFQLDQPVYLYQ